MTLERLGIFLLPLSKSSNQIHTRETVNLYTAGAPWKEKLTVSGVGVAGSN